jgi:hypothetical protein
VKSAYSLIKVFSFPFLDVAITKAAYAHNKFFKIASSTYQQTIAMIAASCKNQILIVVIALASLVCNSQIFNHSHYRNVLLPIAILSR